MRNNIGIFFSLILLLSGVYCYVKSPEVMKALHNCESSKSNLVMMAMVPRIITIASALSKIMNMYTNISAYFKYKKKVKEYEANFPVESKKKKKGNFFIIFIILIFVLVIFSFNSYKIVLLHYYCRDNTMILFFVIFYVQNFSMCMTEIEFIAHCFGLYQKFQSINEEMYILKSKTISTNRYPLVLIWNKHNNNQVGADSIFYSPKIKKYPADNSIDVLKMRHQFISDLVSDLNELYNFQLGLSLSVLFIMSLLDIYDTVSKENTTTKTYLLFYGWMAQYLLRFSFIVLTTQATSKQVQ
jgi:hypothetical protein